MHPNRKRSIPIIIGRLDRLTSLTRYILLMPLQEQQQCYLLFYLDCVPNRHSSILLQSVEINFNNNCRYKRFRIP